MIQSEEPRFETDYEYRMSLQEAAIAVKPFLKTADCVGFDDILDNCGIYINEGDIDAMVQENKLANR